MSQTQRIGSVHTEVTRDNAGITQVWYHDTAVVTFDDNTIRLNTGGWFTQTTKVRMNQASNEFNLGYYVYQSKGKWYVKYNNQIYPFTGDSMILKWKIA